MRSVPRLRPVGLRFAQMTSLPPRPIRRSGPDEPSSVSLRSVPFARPPRSRVSLRLPLVGSLVRGVSRITSQCRKRPDRTERRSWMPPRWLYGLMCRTSLPGPQSTSRAADPLLTHTVSLPSSPLMWSPLDVECSVSLPGPPLMKSVAGPPWIVSSPAPPEMWSPALPPSIRSLSGPPRIRSPPKPPTIQSAPLSPSSTSPPEPPVVEGAAEDPVSAAVAVDDMGFPRPADEAVLPRGSDDRPGSGDAGCEGQHAQRRDNCP